MHTDGSVLVEIQMLAGKDHFCGRFWRCPFWTGTQSVAKAVLCLHILCARFIVPGLHCFPCRINKESVLHPQAWG